MLELEPASLDLREVENVIDDAQQCLCGLPHGGERLPLHIINALPFQHLHHAEHAVHRCADFVTHDGKERRFCLVRGLRLHARAVGGFPLGLSGFLGKRQGLLAPPHFGNVVVHGEQTAVVEVPVLVLDISAGFGAALVTIPTRRAHARRDLVYLGLDVGDFAVFASVDQVANEVVSGHTGIGDVARISVQIAVMLVAEAPTEILVEQRDSVGHIVEDALCHPISALAVVARRQCFGLRLLGRVARGFGGPLCGRQRLLAFLERRDVAIESKHAPVGQLLEIEFHVTAIAHAPLVASPAGRADNGGAFLNDPFDVLFALDRPKIVTPRQEAQHVVGGAAGTGDFRRDLQELREVTIGEFQIEVLVSQDHAVAEVVEDALCHLIGALDVVARR